jgi:hypothetical protein
VIVYFILIAVQARERSRPKAVPYKTIYTAPYTRSLESSGLCLTYRVFQKECNIPWENVPYVKLHRDDQKYIYPNLDGY